MTGVRVIDLRSDTVTRPTPAMREAMAAAEVGDDVYGEDPTVNRLQEEAAALLGKEAALFVPSGTMANQASLRTLTRPGDILLAGEGAHLLRYESGAPAALAGVHVQTIGRGGLFDGAELRAAINPDESHFAPTRAVAVENTHNTSGGRVFPLDQIKDVAAAARERGLSLHLDGARLFNAVVATGTPAHVWAEPFDTATFCLAVAVLVAAPVLRHVPTDLRLAAARRTELAETPGSQAPGPMRTAGVEAPAPSRQPSPWKLAPLLALAALGARRVRAARYWITVAVLLGVLAWLPEILAGAWSRRTAALFEVVWVPQAFWPWVLLAACLSAGWGLEALLGREARGRWPGPIVAALLLVGAVWPLPRSARVEPGAAVSAIAARAGEGAVAWFPVPDGPHRSQTFQARHGKPTLTSPSSAGPPLWPRRWRESGSDLLSMASGEAPATSEGLEVDLERFGVEHVLVRRGAFERADEIYRVLDGMDRWERGSTDGGYDWWYRIVATPPVEAR